MKADKAKKRADDYNDTKHTTNYNDILKLITDASGKGQYFVEVGSMSSKLVDRLEKDGYIVKAANPRLFSKARIEWK